jgi:hypothetical protein
MSFALVGTKCENKSISFNYLYSGIQLIVSKAHQRKAPFVTSKF